MISAGVLTGRGADHIICYTRTDNASGSKQVPRSAVLRDGFVQARIPRSRIRQYTAADLELHRQVMNVLLKMMSFAFKMVNFAFKVAGVGQKTCPKKSPVVVVDDSTDASKTVAVDNATEEELLLK